jgi:copper chaperone CopZ
MVTIKVEGMHCKSCEMLLADSIGGISGVKSVKADSKAGTVTVDCSKEAVHAVKKTIMKEGYKVLD